MKILIVDDYEADRFLLDRAVRKHFPTAEIFTAGTKDEAVDLAEQHIFSLVLSDIRMETELSGYLLCQHLQIRYHGIVPVVLITGESESFTVSAGASAGAYQTLSKDRLDQLPEVVENAITEAFQRIPAVAEVVDTVERSLRTLLQTDRLDDNPHISS